MDPCEGTSKSGKMDAESSPSSKDDTLSTDKNNKTLKLVPSIEIAKKRVRAFSIQKKTPIAPMLVSKTTSSSNTTPVIIGKLAGAKVTPKVEPDPEQKKLKPPKPGASRRAFQDSYIELQKRTLSEIEDMKRKMELVELGIPLGLICPTSTSEKAMPTKAMPPIKSFLDQSKVDELIREAKKAKQEGREYKFDYHKLLPDYDNPFQKRKDEPQLALPNTYEKERKSDRRRSETERERDKEKDRRRIDRYENKRNDYKKESKYKERDKERRHEEAARDTTDEKETDVNLNDYLVCDSWSLENDDKNSTTSPKVTEKPVHPLPTIPPILPLPPILEQKIPLPSDPLPNSTKNESLQASAIESETTEPIKIEKLKPVMDSFKYEIDPNDDEILDIFDEDSELDRYAQQTKAKHRAYYDSPNKSMDYDQDNTKDTSMDGLNDDTFLESVIDEIKQETLSDDGIHDKGLVEYEMSPNKEESPVVNKRSSVTPEIDDKIMNLRKRRSYSEGYRSSDSYRSVDTLESGYKSVDSFRLSVEKELDGALEAKMSKSTVDSLETWSFVLKICQPLLFRHDKNKCYKETRTNPKLWFVENPKACDCVKDRGVVYDELEMCKMALVDRVYGCDQIPDAPFPMTRKWYPRNSLCSTENTPVPLSNEWEAEDSQLADRGNMGSTCTTPLRNDEMSLDREYQRFMEAVWPDVGDTKKETSRSTTPVRHESRKKKKEDAEKDAEEKKPKKIKLSSEGWSQESDIEEDDKCKKQKMEKVKAKSRKRKRSSSTLSSSVSENEEEARKKRKLLKKKAIKKAKSKSAKRRRIGRRLLKKLKEKQKKRNKEREMEEDDSDRKREKKLKKKKQQKLKKKEAKKKKKLKAQSSSSSSSSSSDSSDSESDGHKKSKKAKKRAQEEKKKAKKLRKRSSSDSAQSFEEDLFDENILNNIKTERLTDDEKVGHKMMEFSPRRQKPREIINVKELQNDFVGNIHIKQETIEGTPKPKELPSELPQELPKELPKELPIEDIQKEEVPKAAIPKDNLVTKTAAAKVVDVPKVHPQPVKVSQDVPPVRSSPVPDVPPPAGVPIPVLDESNMSQASSQESLCSITTKDAPIFYEKDESHLRPSSQNSNYSFNDVINASQNSLYQKDIETITAHQNAQQLYDKEIGIKVEQSLYPNKIESLSGDYSKSQVDYRKKSTGQSDYSKISASQSDYSKSPASESDYTKRIEVTTSEIGLYDKEISENECDDKYGENYEAGNYEMYEQMAMAYQSDVASKQRSRGAGDAKAQGEGGTQRIETVVGACTHGEIKCDWRAGDAPATPHCSQRPSRWGLKPGQVNIVLTGDGSQFPQQDAPEAEPVYHIQSIANRTDTSTDYDEAYMDMYGAADRLQYGDCFSDNIDVSSNITPISLNIQPVSPDITPISGNIQHISPNIVPVKENVPTVAKKESRPCSLDDRINKVLQETVLGGIANEIDGDKDTSEKGKSARTATPRVVKRVSFADGYKPGQDSDVEEPPTKKRKRPRRTGSAWPCPATHPDHVPLWDALPPPPPPPGSPPPAPRPAPSLHLLRAHHRRASALAMPEPMGKFDPSVPLAGFMPPEPPPGLLTLQLNN